MKGGLILVPLNNQFHDGSQDYSSNICNAVVVAAMYSIVSKTIGWTTNA